ncbi:MAG: DUF799 domain-containing protein [Treponema sp.]|nr:DUF799 domain-containing protein [Treponema sp.]
MKTRNKFFAAILSGLFVLMISSCASGSLIERPMRIEHFQLWYEENPNSILIMPPINKTANVDAKEFFYSTLAIPVADAGYYTIPPFVAMETLKKEGAYYAEDFSSMDLSLFRDYFNCDVVLFTEIESWEKLALLTTGGVNVTVKYTFKSAKSNEILFEKEFSMTYDTSTDAFSSISTGSSMLNLVFAAVDTAMTAVKTVNTDYCQVAEDCTRYALKDLPKGKYHVNYGLDAQDKFIFHKEESKSLDASYYHGK